MGRALAFASLLPCCHQLFFPAQSISYIFRRDPLPFRSYSAAPTPRLTGGGTLYRSGAGSALPGLFYEKLRREN